MFHLNPVKAAIAPYLFWIKVVGIAIILSIVFYGGCRVQRAADAEVIAKKNTALVSASASLRAAGNALRDQNSENERRIKAAETTASLAQTAGKIAEAEKREADLKLARFERNLETAMKKRECEILLNSDIRKVCNL